MTYPIQRQSETYGIFEDEGLRFAKEYHTRDLPDGLVNMLKGPRISTGMNQRHADIPVVDTSAVGGASTEGYSSTNGAVPGGLSAVPGSAGFDNPMQYGGPESSAAGAQGSQDRTIARRHQGGDFDAQYDYSRPSVSDLYAHEPHHMGDEEFEQEYPGGEPRHYTEDAFREQPQAPLQPLNEMLEHARRPDMEPPPHDYLAQFRPHLASFTEARSQHTAEDGPAPGPGLFTPMMFQPRPPSLDSLLMGGEKAFANDQPVAQGEKWVTAAVQPQVVPGWIGHGYAPGHRVGLPWREQVIPGTVTHLDGPAVGIRWDDGQHSTEEPKDLRPL